MQKIMGTGRNSPCHSERSWPSMRPSAHASRFWSPPTAPLSGLMVRRIAIENRGDGVSCGVGPAGHAPVASACAVLVATQTKATEPVVR
jgi:hypothetical protein